MRKKLGFALGAGGSRGVAHIGFLKAMEEAGIKPDYITGTSMGSIVGACYAKGYSADFMLEEVKKLSLIELLDVSINPLMNGALLRAQKMRNKLSKYVNEDVTFNELSIPFRCVAVDLNTGNPVVFKEDDKVCEAIVASSTIPGIFRPVTKGNMMLVDGGLKCRLPINEVKEMGAEVVVAIDVLGRLRPSYKKRNVFSLLFRAYDIMDDEITRRKLKEEKADLIITPDLGDMDLFRLKELTKAYEQGYKAGKENVDKILKLIEQKPKRQPTKKNK